MNIAAKLSRARGCPTSLATWLAGLNYTAGQCHSSERRGEGRREKRRGKEREEERGDILNIPEAQRAFPVSPGMTARSRDSQLIAADMTVRYKRQ